MLTRVNNKRKCLAFDDAKILPLFDTFHMFDYNEGHKLIGKNEFRITNFLV